MRVLPRAFALALGAGIVLLAADALLDVALYGRSQIIFASRAAFVGDLGLHAAALSVLAAGLLLLAQRWAGLTHAHRATQEELGLASAIVDTAGCLVVVLDEAGHITRFNRACEEVTGYTAEEVRGRAFWDVLLAPEELEQVKAVFAQLQAGDFPNQHENHWLAKDGRRRLISWWNTALTAAEGRGMYVIGIGVDVTEHRAAEAEVRIAHRALEASLSAVAICDREGQLVYANPSFAHLWGYATAKEMLDRPTRNSWPLGLLATTSEASHPEYPTVRELTLRRKDGTAFEAQVASVLIRDAAGVPVGAMVSCLDVTEQKRAQRALQESEARYRLLAENIADVLWVQDLEGRYTYVSPSVTGQRGYRPEEMIGRPVEQFMTPASAEVTRDAKVRLQAAAGGPPSAPSAAVELELLRKDGVTFWAETHIALLRDDEGQVVASVGTSRDLTDRKRMEQQLREQREWFETTLASVGDAVIATDTTTAVVFMNRVAEALTGFEAEEALGRPIAQVFRARRQATRAEVPDPAGQALRHGVAIGTIRDIILVARDEREIPIDAHAAPIRGRGGQTVGAVLAFRDVTERVEAETRLRHQAYHDALTGLPNRALLCDRLEVALARAQRGGGKAALLLLDLDDSKYVNDAFGHSMGDELLRQLTHRLGEHLRGSETLARLGGDEFALLLPEISQAEVAADVARRLGRLVSAPFSLSGHQVHVTVSIGIGVYPEDGPDAAALLKHADVALYHAKDAGKNSFRFHTPEMNACILQRVGVESGLRAALRSQQLVPHYQPILDTLSGRVVSAEALVRWQHPQLGLLLPKDFIGVAEETGMIEAIDEAVLRQACRQRTMWEEMGCHDLGVSVNVSARHFHREGLVDAVAAALAEAGLDPKRLMLEITETTIMRNPRLSLSVMRQLKELGVRLALDDFGVGHSSLGALKQFPVDSLKIDRTFIGGLAADPKDELVVETIIRLAHQLGMMTVAEGVETQGQWQFLRAHRCDHVQGFLFGRPAPASEIANLVAQQRAAAQTSEAESPVV